MQILALALAMGGIMAAAASSLSSPLLSSSLSSSSSLLSSPSTLLRGSSLPSAAMKLNRLRGGAWFDKRTPMYWPMHAEGEVPADGSVGGQYTFEEICSAGQQGLYIGETSPYTIFAGATLHIIMAGLFMIWINRQPWVPELM